LILPSYSRVRSSSIVRVIGVLLLIGSRTSFAGTGEAAESKVGSAAVRAPFESLPDAPVPNVLSTTDVSGSWSSNEASDNLVTESPAPALVGATG
jgi:hypothetical protein